MKKTELKTKIIAEEMDNRFNLNELMVPSVYHFFFLLLPESFKYIHVII